jgi:hypothetical protein
VEQVKTWGPATILIVVLVVAVAVIGGVVVVVDPQTLSFPEYLSKLQVFAIGIGLLGLGRGTQAGLERYGQAVAAGIAEKSKPAATGRAAHAPPHGDR